MRNTGHKAARDLRECGNILRKLRVKYAADDGNVDFILRRAAAACEHCRRQKIEKRIFRAVDDIVREFTEVSGIPSDEKLTPDYIAARLDEYKPDGQDDAFTLDELCFVPDCISLSLLFTLYEYNRAEHDLKHKEETASEEQTEQGKRPAELAADAASIGAELLRGFEEISFERFLEKASEIERTLLADKRGIYPRCDQDTKQLYRQAAAEYARRHKVSQRDAAELVLAMRSPVKKHPVLRKLYFPVMYIAAFVLAIAAAVYANGDLVLALLLYFPLTEFMRQSLDFLLSRFVPPGAVPRFKLERSDNVPETLVVITTLLFGGKSDNALFESLERCYHANRDKGGNIAFGILGDLPDAASPELPSDAETLKNARKRINALNKKYGSGFYLFTRSRTYSATEERYMGRERKRGALLELAGLIAAGKRGTLTVTGDEEFLSRVKYVITLDSDTRLGLGGACDMIGAMLHPANRPVVKNGVVTEGYAIMQPRMETSLEAAGKTPFSRLISGCGGSDVYSTAAYETYQTLFGEGNFCGKGIFDVKIYWELLENAFAPETILSHDLLEGTRLRCAYLSGVTATDSCPKTAASYFNRLHRWIRGDTQAAAYAGNTIVTGSAAERAPSPSALGITDSAGLSEYRRRARVKNPINTLSKYKLFDNIRRAVTPVCAILAMAYGLAAGRDAALTAIVFALLYLVLPVITASATAARSLPRRFYSSVTGGVWQALGMSVWNIACLLHNAIIAADAMLRALWRMTVSRQHLLQWVTAAEADRNRRDTLRYNLWLTFPSFITGAVLVVFAPYGLYKFLGLLWLGLPLFFTLTGRETITEAESAITPARRAVLTKYVFDMWKYFADTVTASDNWLPPDNIQLAPVEMLARRTSPTNIGLYLLSCLAVCKLGDITTDELFMRLENTLTSVESMPKWHGHLYNWYDTATLSVLGTPYVSTVDSGNFAVCLLTLSRGLEAEKELAGERADNLRTRIDALLAAMDFSVLYNPDRDLFYLGFDTAAGKPGGGYDLLMSESRITSYYTVAAGIVPRIHWQRLGRPVISADGHIGLLSWSGTMFEYFMASLFLPVYRGSLIDEALAFAFTQQKKERCRNMWGKSESCYFAFDAMTYQYSAYGVQRLAMKRGLDKEAVISPYSSFLTLTYAPLASMRNLERLKKFGMYGKYGFFEAVDFTRSRVGGGCAVIRNFMAHHVGMSIIAAANLCTDNAFVGYFMSDPRMGAADNLLCEKIPVDAVIHKTVPYRKDLPLRTFSLPTAQHYREDNHAVPRTAIVSNGGARIVATAAGKVCLYNGDRLVTTSPFGAGRSYGGLRLFMEVSDKRGTRVIDALNGGFCRSASSTSVKYIADAGGGGARAKTMAILTVRGDCACFVATLVYEGGAADVCPLLCFIPALKPEKEYSAHPGYHDLSVESEYCAEENILLYRVLSREGESERWLAVTLETSGGGVSFATRREGILPMLYGDRELAMLTEKSLDNTTGACITPFCAIKKRSYTKSGRYACSFLIAPAKSRSEAVQNIRYVREHRERNYADSAIASLRRWARAGLSVLSAPDSMRAAELLLAVTFHRLRTDTDPNNPDSEKPRLAEPQPRSALWRNSISGDLPFTVISISTRLMPGDASCHLIAAFMAAHRWLRIMGVKTELVICYGEIAAYGEPLRTLLIDLAREHGDVSMLGAPGGVYLLRGSPDTALLRMLSRLDIVLDGTNTLSSVYARVMRERPELVFPVAPKIHAYNPQTVDYSVETDVRLPVRGGFFGVDNYTVKTREQKLPQSYIYANCAFGTLITHNGLGYTWFGNARERRLTPWNGVAPEGMQGERLVLYTPGASWDLAASAHTVSFGRGYAVYSGRIECTGISTGYEISVGVDPLLPVKLITVTFDRAEIVPRAEVRDNVGGLFAPEGITLNRSGLRLAFELTLCFGADPCDPEAIERECKGDTATYRCMFGDFTHRRIFVTCRPCDHGVIYLLGTTGERDDKCGEYIREKYKTRSDVAGGFSSYAARAEYVSGGFLLESSDRALDEMFNFYVPYQALTARLLARTGFYQSGGAYGFRDQLQDCLAIMYSNPNRARVHIIRAAAHQFAQGDALHWWHNLPARDTVVTRGVRTLCSDDYIWLPYAAAEYVMRTGDTSLLSVKVRYADAPELASGEFERYSEIGKTDFKEDVYTHCARALELALDRLSPRGLPYIGSCDWNDGMNRIGIGADGSETGGESVWLAQFLAITLQKFSALSELRGDLDGCEKYSVAASSLLLAVEKHAWAGDRYARAFYGDGVPLGTAETEGGCQIDILPQAFARLSGMGGDDGNGKKRTETALVNMYGTLFDREYKIMKLFSPPFVPGTGRNPGYIQGYVPGVRENGGQYTHAAVWAAIALLDAGMTDSGTELLIALNPASRYADADTKLAERYGAEPYALAGDVYSNPDFAGRCGWSIYTGAATWYYKAVLEYLLGYNERSDGFTITPKLSGRFPIFTLQVNRRGTQYTIRAESGNKTEYKLDGKIVNNSFKFDKKRHLLEITVEIKPGR